MCQKTDWPRHRVQCQPLQAQRNKAKEKKVLQPPLGVTEEAMIMKRDRNFTSARVIKPNPIIQIQDKQIENSPAAKRIKSEDIPVYFANFQFYSTGQENKYLFIVFPGELTDAKDYVKYIQSINIQNCCYLVLQPPQELPFHSGWSWFPMFDGNSDLITPSEGDNKRLAGLTRTRKWVIRLLQNLIQQYQWVEENVFLIGFSQGAATAIDLVFHSGLTKSLGGVLCISDSILDEALFQNFVEAYPEKSETPLPPVLITHGEKDHRVPIQVAKDKAMKLQELYAEHGSKSTISLESFEKGHQMVASKAELSAIIQFFMKNMK